MCGQRALFHSQRTGLIDGERAVVAEIEQADAGLDQRSEVLEAAAAARGLVDVERVGGVRGIQGEHGIRGVAEHRAARQRKTAAGVVAYRAAAVGVGVDECRVVECDGGGADLLQDAGHGQRAAAYQRAVDHDIATGNVACRPVVSATDLRLDLGCDQQRAAGLNEARCDVAAIAQCQRAAGQRELAGTTDLATGGQRGRAACHPQQGAVGHLLRAVEQHRVVQRGRAFADDEGAELVERKTAEAAEVHVAGTALGERAGIHETAGGARVVIDVQITGGRLADQRQRSGVAEHGTVFQIEATAGCVGDTAVATVVVVQQRSRIDEDRRVAGLIEYAIEVEYAAAVDGAAGPGEAAVDVGAGATAHGERAVAHRMRGRDARVVAEHQRATALQQRTCAGDRTARRQGRAAAHHLKHGTPGHRLRAVQADRAAQGEAAGIDVQHAVLHEGHVAEVADVGAAGARLGQRAAVLEASAKRAAVLIDVEDARWRLDRQRECAAVAQHAAVLDVETAGRCVGDAAVATGVGMFERRFAQIDGRVAALVEHARQREHAAAGDRAGGPGQVARHGGRAAHIQRAAAQIDVGPAAGHIQIDGAGIDVQRGQAEVCVDVRDIAGDAQHRRRQPDCRIEIHRAAAWRQHGKGQAGRIERRGAVRLIEAGDGAAAVCNELACAAAHRHTVQVERAERFEQTAGHRQRAADAGGAIHCEAATGDRQGFFRRQRSDGPCAGADRDRRREADTVEQHGLVCRIGRHAERPVAADRPVAAAVVDPLVDAGERAAGAEHVVGRTVVIAVAETGGHVERTEGAARHARVVAHDAQAGVRAGREAGFVQRAQRAAEGDRAGDVQRVVLGAALRACDAYLQRAGATEHQIAGQHQQAVRAQQAGVGDRVAAGIQVAGAADGAAVREARGRGDGPAFQTQRAGIRPAPVAAELEGSAGGGGDGGAGEGAADTHIDVAGLSAGEGDAGADVERVVAAVGGDAVVDGAAGEIECAVAGDVQGGWGGGVGAQIGPGTGGGQADGGPVERERAARLHGLSVVDDEQSGAVDPVDAGQGGVDEVAGAIHAQRAAGRIVGADGAAGDGAAEQCCAGGVVEQQG